MSLAHQFQGDHERLAAAAGASFNDLLPIGSAVMLLPEPVPAPMKTKISGPAFVQGLEVFVPVEGQEKPVNIKRLKEGWRA